MMAIPVILPYPMPTVADLPENKVDWSPDSRRAVLLIHDMQNYFLTPFTKEESPMVELIENIQFLRSQCKELGIPIFYTGQPGGQLPENRGLLTDFWGPGIPADPSQEKIIDELAPWEEDIVLTKWRYSAFKKTDLRERMKELGRNQLIICGVYAHIGCLMTACDAFMQDIQPFLVADGVADFTFNDHVFTLNYAAKRCAVTITAKNLLNQLRRESIEHKCNSF